MNQSNGHSDRGAFALSGLPYLMERYGRRNGWSAAHGWMVYLFAALGIAVTWDAWASIAHIAYYYEESSHIFLVPIIAIWLTWVRRERFRFCRPRETWVGPGIVVVGALCSWMGYYQSADLPFHLGAVLVLTGCIFSVLGGEVLSRFLPAVFVLVFLVPVPQGARLAIAEPLHGALAVITEGVFDLVGMEISRSSNALEINGQRVAIAEACNGLRMVFALTLVSYAFAFGLPLRGYVRFLIVGLSPVFAMFCNVIRMIPTVWVYGMSGEKIFGIDGQEFALRFHDFIGWVMLIVAFLLLMGILKALRWAMLPVARFRLAYD